MSSAPNNNAMPTIAPARGPPTPPASSAAAVVAAAAKTPVLFPPHTHSPPQDAPNDLQEGPEKFEQLFERKRKRRESHNVVERRRREFINERIDELYTLMDGSAENKPSRGHILKLTVDYLRDLQAQSIKQQYRLQELEARLASPNH